MSEFWVRTGELVRGPFQIAQLKQLAASGEITEADFIRKGDDGKWVPTPRVRGLFGKVAAHSAATEEASGDADSTSTAVVGRREPRKAKSHESEPGKQRWYLPTDEITRDGVGQIVVNVIVVVVLMVGASFYGTVTEWFTGSSPDPSLVDADADALDAEEASTVYNNRGVALANTGNLTAAVAHYTKGLQRKPNDVILLENRRIAYRGLGNFEAAIRDQEKVMRLRTPTAQDHETCGLLFVEADKSKEAMAHYDSSIEMDPTVASAWFRRGLLHRNIEHLSEAIGDLATALTLTSDGTVKADIHHARALIYEEQGETARALEDYESSIKWAQPYPDKSRIAVFHFNRGDLLENMGEKDRALADYNQAIALDRDKSAFFTGRASLLREMGKVDDAKRDEERAKELQPTDQ